MGLAAVQMCIVDVNSLTFCMMMSSMSSSKTSGAHSGLHVRTPAIRQMGHDTLTHVHVCSNIWLHCIV
jgi:hypothetical protein